MGNGEAGGEAASEGEALQPHSNQSSFLWWKGRARRPLPPALCCSGGSTRGFSEPAARNAITRAHPAMAQGARRGCWHPPAPQPGRPGPAAVAARQVVVGLGSSLSLRLLPEQLWCKELTPGLFAGSAAPGWPGDTLCPMATPAPPPPGWWHLVAPLPGCSSGRGPGQVPGHRGWALVVELRRRGAMEEPPG